MPDPIAYAEDTLGVHQVYNSGLDDLSAHTIKTERVQELNDTIRWAKDALETAELDIIADERAKEHGLSKTAFGDHLKEVLRADTTLRAKRQEIAMHEAERNGLELELRHHALGVQMATARMQELGGLLTFYAACKLNSRPTPVSG